MITLFDGGEAVGPADAVLAFLPAYKLRMVAQGPEVQPDNSVAHSLASASPAQLAAQLTALGYPLVMVGGIPVGTRKCGHVPYGGYLPARPHVRDEHARRDRPPQRAARHPRRGVEQARDMQPRATPGQGSGGRGLAATAAAAGGSWWGVGSCQVCCGCRWRGCGGGIGGLTAGWDSLPVTDGGCVWMRVRVESDGHASLETSQRPTVVAVDSGR